jgi:hypothetical protein
MVARVFDTVNRGWITVIGAVEISLAPHFSAVIGNHDVQPQPF